MRPSEKDYSPHFKSYVDQVKMDDILNVLEVQLNTASKLFSDIPEEKGNYAYAKGKWSIKEVLGHVIDSERVFAYRTLCIARGEQQSLPGFEQDDYVKEGGFNNRTIQDLLEEFASVRKANLVLFKTFSENELNKRGVANNSEVTVRALLFIIAGHGMHHINILKDKYGV